MVLLSFFVIHDTSLIAGGKYSLGYDDYIIGALLLYTVSVISILIFYIGYYYDIFLDLSTTGAD